MLKRIPCAMEKGAANIFHTHVWGVGFLCQNITIDKLKCGANINKYYHMTVENANKSTHKGFN